MSIYTESETGAAMCGQCDRWIDGIGGNRCSCCSTCSGEGMYDPTTAESGDAAYMKDCEDCDGTGRNGAAP